MTGSTGATTTDDPPAAAAIPAVAISGLSKAYGGIQALQAMDLVVESGTIHAVVGENGAGKSTLMKILAGAVQPDSGEVMVAGERVAFASPADARHRGIGIVYQELSLLPERSVLANVYVDDQPTRFGLVDRGAMRRGAAPTLRRLGLRVDPDRALGDLGVAERQLVELSRVLIERPRVLILDEPNSALNQRETERLFGILRELSASGITILYVSHRLDEVFQLADRITVMRNGAAVLTRDRRELSMKEVVVAMIGASPAAAFPPRRAAASAPGDGEPDTSDQLVVTELSVGEELTGVSFAARPREILGLAGLEGSGVATLLGVLFGTRHATAGSIRFGDGQAAPRSPTEAARRRISLVPADRRNQGLMLEASVARNIAHVSVGALRQRDPLLRLRELRTAAARQIRALDIRGAAPDVPAGRLSGGNQQKVVVGKWLEIGPSVFLLDDPTRGVDVGAKREIYRLIRELADAGRVVLFRSTELPELVGLADRILVFYRGRLTAELAGGQVDDHALLHAINTGRLPDPGSTAVGTAPAPTPSV